MCMYVTSCFKIAEVVKILIQYMVYIFKKMFLAIDQLRFLPVKIDVATKLYGSCRQPFKKAS